MKKLKIYFLISDIFKYKKLITIAPICYKRFNINNKIYEI